MIMSTLLHIAFALFAAITNAKNHCAVPNRYDYIVIGAGTAGSIVASELSKRYSVLLIEEGGFSSQWDAINDTSKFWEVLSEPQIARGYVSTPQINVSDRIMSQPTAKITGGTGSWNTLQFVLGQRKDFDERWNIDGWKWNDLEPFWQHITDTFKTTKIDRNDDEWLSRFINVAENNGYEFVPEADDLSNLADPTNITFIKKISGQVINENFGQRTSSWTAYIEPILGKRDNLHVLVHTRVNKILFKTRNKPRAIGVETFGIGDNKIHEFYVKHEVILSAGAYDSPKILMLSGVGDCDYLISMDIECIANVPAVGKHLEDHIRFPILSPPLKDQNTEIPSTSWPWIYLNYFVYSVKEAGEHETGLSLEDLSAEPPVSMGIPAIVFTSVNRLHQLHSRGQVLLKDNNPESSPIIDPKYFSDKRDEEKLINAFRESRKLLYDDILTPFYLESADEIFPGFDVDSDEEIIAWYTDSIPHFESTYHPGSTCKMGNVFSKYNSDDIVVNNELKVRGVSHLRIIDHSIAPRVVSADTNQVTMLIAFKGSDIILSSHHLKKKIFSI